MNIRFKEKDLLTLVGIASINDVLLEKTQEYILGKVKDDFVKKTAEVVIMFRLKQIIPPEYSYYIKPAKEILNLAGHK